MMSTYEIGDLIQLWAFEKITPEQAIGQLLVHLQKLSQKVGELERQGQVQRPMSEGSGKKEEAHGTASSV